jgi:hypothetical protein
VATGKARNAAGTISVGRWTAPIAGIEPALEVLEGETAVGSRFSLTVWAVAQPPFKIDQQVMLSIAAPEKRLQIRAKLSARSKTADRMFLAFERC